MAKTYKNDIFDVLKNIDNKNYQYFESLSSEQQKEIQPYTLCRWMSAIYGQEKQHIQLTKLVNNNVNTHYWELSKYKDLQFKLLCTCGLNKSFKHQWIAQSKNKNDKNYNLIRNFYKNLSDDEFDLKYQSMTSDEIKNIQKFLGLLDK